MPVVQFGERPGMFAGDHKDTRISESAFSLRRSYASDTTMRLRCADFGTGNKILSLMRFSLTGHIPATAIVNSSTLHLFLSISPANNMTDINVRRMITNWGVTNVDEGVSQSPANGGQATWARSYDYAGGPGDTVWGGGGNISAVDWDAAEDQFTIAAFSAAGTEYLINIPIMTQLWIANDATNYGLAIEKDALPGTPFCTLDSQESATVAERPYLEVDYTVPAVVVTSDRVGQSRIHISNSIAI